MVDRGSLVPDGDIFELEESGSDFLPDLLLGKPTYSPGPRNGALTSS